MRSFSKGLKGTPLGYLLLASTFFLYAPDTHVYGQAKFTKSAFTLSGYTTFANSNIDFVDFNNDGRLDLFKINGNTVQFFINKPGTTLTFQKEPYQITTTGLIWAKPIDYNFDGLTDVAIYNGSLTIYLTELEGVSYINTPISITTASASGKVIFQDINNDTQIDILQLNEGAFNVYTNVGNNVFELGYSYSFENYLAQYLTNFRIINYNNDIHYDVAMGPYIFTNFGNSIFSFTHSFYRDNEYLGGGFISVENSLFTDINFDNRIDSYVNFSLIGSSLCGEQNFYSNANSLLQYLNGSNGIFDLVKKSDSYDCNLSVETKLIGSADFDGDSKADLLSTLLSYYRDEYDGSVSNVTNQIPFGLTSVMNEVSNVNDVFFSILDINKDGRIDLAYIYNGKLTFLLNVMGTTPATVPAPSGLVSAIADTEVKTSWTAPANCIGCTYDIYLRKGIDTVYLSNVGNVQSPSNGNWNESNLGSTTNWLFKNLENGVYNWSVRVNYQSKKLSAFATENSFTINRPGNGNELAFNSIIDFDGAVAEDNSVWLALQKSNGATFSKYTYSEVSSSFVKVSQDAFRLNAKKSKVTSLTSNNVLLKSYLKGDSLFLLRDKAIVMKHKLLYPLMEIEYAITHSSTNNQYLIAIVYTNGAQLHLQKVNVTSGFQLVAASSKLITSTYDSDASRRFSLRFSHNVSTKNYFLLVTDVEKALYIDDYQVHNTEGTFLFSFNSNLQEISTFSDKLPNLGGYDSFLEFDSYNNKIVSLNRNVNLVIAGVYGYEYPTYEISIGNTQLTYISNGVPNTGARLPYLARLSKRNEYAAFWLNQDNSTLFYNYLDPQSLLRQIPNDQIVETISSKKYKILSNSSASSLLLGWIKGTEFNLKRLDLFKNPPPELLSMNVPKVGNAYRAYAGDLVKITGKNFGKTTLTNTVKFGTIQATVVQGLSNGNEITVTVPPGLSRAPVPVTVAFDDQQGESTFLFENLTLPIVTSIDKTVGEVGDIVTVNGDKFSTDASQIAVRFGAVGVAQNEILSLTSTQIKVKVPELAQRGSNQSVSVVIQDQVVSAPQLFRIIIPPVIEAVETETDFISCKQVVIRGKNFGTNANALQVKFGDIVVPSSSITATDVAILVNVPLGAEKDIKISVKLDDREALSETISAKLGSYIEPGSNQHPHNFNLTARKDDKIDLRIKILNECSVQEVKFWTKGISEPDLNWKNEVLTTLDANRIDHVILEDAMTDPIGLAAYYEILDKSSKLVRSDTFFIHKNYAELDSTNNVPALNFGGDVSAYNIISVPYQLTPNNIPSVFKDLVNKFGSDSSKWRLFHYLNTATQDKYIEYTRGLDKIEPGKGYWMIVRYPQEIFIEGAQAVDLSNGPFEITLEPGWNQIGNPYNFAISWTDVLTYNNNPADLESLKVVTNGALQNGTTLPRFRGGFVKYNGTAPLVLKIPYTRNNSLSGGRFAATNRSSDFNDKQWYVPFTLASSTVSNETVGVGMHPQATEGFDALDETRLPKFFNQLDIAFKDNLASSIVPTGDQYTWTFEVHNATNDKNLTLTWPTDFGDNDRELYLYDVNQERIVDMRVERVYSFSYPTSKTFKLVYGNRSYVEENLVPERDLLGDAYPNPFSTATVLPFTVTNDNTHVKLIIYNLLGQEVTTLLDQNLSAGFYEIPWNGTDSSGSSISSGTFIYQLQSTDKHHSKTQSRKLILN